MFQFYNESTGQAPNSVKIVQAKMITKQNPIEVKTMPYINRTTICISLFSNSETK